MFDKFTERARQALSLAQDEARSLGQAYVGTEHVLLALMKQEDGIASAALSELGADYEQAKNLVAATSAKAPTQADSGGHIPFTPRTKRVLEGAYRETITRGQMHISTEHLLLGIVREGQSMALQILAQMGISDEAVKREIEKLMQSGNSAGGPGSGGIGAGQAGQGQAGRSGMPPGMSGIPGMPPGMQAIPVMPQQDEGPLLESYGRNLTKLAQDGTLDPVIGREREVERIMQVLARRQKNNPLILGDPGVGKTAIAEGLAQLIVSGSVPEALRGREIWTLDIAAMVAGSKFRGEFEERLKRVIAEVSANPSIILFIDELHTLIGAGSAEGSMDAASILKPPLSRGEIQVIGATTAEEYRKHIEKDSAFERRFQPVNIDEPSVADTIEILRGLQGRYEKHHHVRYTPSAIEAAALLSSRYIQDRFLPDKAIDVIDEAGAHTRVHKVVVPDEIIECDSELKQIQHEKDLAAARQEFEHAAQLRDSERALIKRREELEEAWHTSLNADTVEVDADDIAAIVSFITGVPVSNLTEEEASKLLRAEGALHERVIGQDEAVESVAKAIRRSRSPLKDPRRPGGSFIFLGPSGVGKTELAKSLAEFLFGSDEALITFDMSEFMEKYAVSKLVGAPPGYVGYDEGGELTKAVRRKPYSVVLFDEIEKAHPDVFNVLLQILDEGRLTDGQGRKVDFSNTVIIMTSNIGAREIATTAPLGFGTSTEQGLSHEEIKSRVMGELKHSFRPEFLNRVDEIVVFSALNKEELRHIVDLMIVDLRNRLIEEGLSIELSDAARDLVAEKGTDQIYGARPLRRAIQTLIEDPLSERLLEGAFAPGHIIKVGVKGDELTFSAKKGKIPAPTYRTHQLPSRHAGGATGEKKALPASGLATEGGTGEAH